MNTTIVPTTACPKCGSEERQVREQQFRDGTRHHRMECSRCRRFLGYAKRQPLPLAPVQARRPAPAPTADLTGTRNRTTEAFSLLRERVEEVDRTIKGDCHDLAMLAALQGSCLSAAACLEETNIVSRAAKIREGRKVGFAGNVQ